MRDVLQLVSSYLGVWLWDIAWVFVLLNGNCLFMKDLILKEWNYLFLIWDNNDYVVGESRSASHNIRNKGGFSEWTMLSNGKMRNDIILHGKLSDQKWYMCSSTPSFLVIKDGRKISSVCDTLFQANDALPFIGIIWHWVVNEEGDVKLGVTWLYTLADVKLAKGASIEALLPVITTYSLVVKASFRVDRPLNKIGPASLFGTKYANQCSIGQI